MGKSSQLIAEQSKRWLVDALLSLMQEKPFNQITITEICKRADLARRTFYRNFNSKEDILSLCIKEKVMDYIRECKNINDFSLPNISRVYFDFWKENLNFAQVLKKNDLLFLLIQEYNRYLPFIHQEVLGDFANFGGQNELSYALLFSAGGFWNILSRWLDEGASKSSDEMAAMVQNILNNFRI